MGTCICRCAHILLRKTCTRASACTHAHTCTRGKSPKIGLLTPKMGLLTILIGLRPRLSAKIPILGFKSCKQDLLAIDGRVQIGCKHPQDPHISLQQLILGEGDKGDGGTFSRQASFSTRHPLLASRIGSKLPCLPRPCYKIGYKYRYESIIDLVPRSITPSHQYSYHIL